MFRALRTAALAFAAVSCCAAHVAAEPLNIATATIAEIQAAYAAGRASAEDVTAAYLKRVTAYNYNGPALHAIIALNPDALMDAKARDAERKAGRVRSPLHGIPVVLKDNIDMAGLPTTAGSQLLADAMPPDDAQIVRRLKDAGAIILGKANLNEFAGAGSIGGDAPPEVRKAGAMPLGFSSRGGQTLNPHDLSRSPLGSSSGSAVAVAAGFAPIGIGTDTSGSIRAPAAAAGVVGFRPTLSTVSTDGVIPLALSFDTAGPLARTVKDVAATMSVIGDAAMKSAPSALNPNALQGARIGVMRDFMGRDADSDAVMEHAFGLLAKSGAVLIDPLAVSADIHAAAPGLTYRMMAAEFKAHIGGALGALAGPHPKNLAELVARANDPLTQFRNPGLAFGLNHLDATALDVQGAAYRDLNDNQLAALRAAIAGLFTAHRLDAIVFPTLSRPPPPLVMPEVPNPPATLDGRSALYLAAIAGLPELSVPAGLTPLGLPVALSIMGPAGDDIKILGLGYVFEHAAQATPIRPRHAPGLPSDLIGK